jgi:Phytanoyl-CoA dioxygenase (PhyH)
MNSVFFDAPFGDDERRKSLYAGQLFAYTPRASAQTLVDFARSLVVEAFGDLDPQTAQYQMPVERYAALLADLKPRFIHHPQSKELLRGMLTEMGCDPERTYFDVPRMRTSTSDGYLTTGIAYAFHPHRDTWYSAPLCQINWWLPIYDIEPDNGMAFHPGYWSRPLRNGSRDYNYHEWNATSRKLAAQQIGVDTRKQPKPEEPVELDPQIRLVTRPGGVILFSAAHLHSSVPNTTGKTRFSIDFRTVHLDDVAGRIGAPNIDSECTGTCMNDYLRVQDLAHVPADLQALYENGTPLVSDEMAMR